MNRLYVNGPKRKKKEEELEDIEEYDDKHVDYDDDEYYDWDGYDDEKDYINIDDPYSMY